MKPAKKMKAEKCPSPSPARDGFGPIPDRGPRNLPPHMDRIAKSKGKKGK